MKNLKIGTVLLFLIGVISFTSCEKEEFIELGEEWWWGTNRMIPINIIFKSRWEKYRSSMVTFSLKDFQVVHGPTISQKNICQKKLG